MSESFDRAAFSAMLKGRAEYLKLKEDSKVPAGSFRPGRRNRYKRLPAKGNYGILPQGQLFVLDIDTHKGGVLEDQEKLFSDFLGVKLTDTLSVTTPSGGMHYYLYLPLGVLAAKDLPKTNLRSFTQEIQDAMGTTTVIDADIRSEAANAYVVGPGSLLKQGPYTLKNLTPIQEVPYEGFQRLVNLRLAKEKRRREESKRWINDALVEARSQESFNQVSQEPAPESLQKLEGALRRKQHMTYHQKRAFVKAALHCCYTNDVIAKVCVTLGINRDSSREKLIPRYALRKDIEEMVISDMFHGPYCAVGVAKRREIIAAHKSYTSEDLQAHLRGLQLRQEARRERTVVHRKVNPQVVSYSRISKTLLEGSAKGVKAKQYQAAMKIVEGFIQPLANAGAEKFLLAQDALMRELDLSKSQASQGLRLLREKGILTVKDRQKQGFAPTYEVTPHYLHKKLTFYLRRTWVEQASQDDAGALLWSPRAGGFVKALEDGMVVESNPLAVAIAASDREVLEAYSQVAPVTGVLYRYLKNQQ